VLDRSADDPEDVGIREFNRYVREHRDLIATMIPMRDGVTLIRKRKKE